MQILAKDIKAGDIVSPTRVQDYKIKVHDVAVHGQTVLLFYTHPDSGQSAVYRKSCRSLINKD